MVKSGGQEYVNGQGSVVVKSLWWSRVWWSRVWWSRVWRVGEWEGERGRERGGERESVKDNSAGNVGDWRNLFTALMFYRNDQNKFDSYWRM